jgi:hypothetical protein
MPQAFNEESAVGAKQEQAVPPLEFGNNKVIAGLARRRYETATSRASGAEEGATIRLVFAVAYCRRNFFT